MSFASSIYVRQHGLGKIEKTTETLKRRDIQKQQQQQQQRWNHERREHVWNERCKSAFRAVRNISRTKSGWPSPIRFLSEVGYGDQLGLIVTSTPWQLKQRKVR